MKKKVLAIVMIMAICLSLYACGGNSSEKAAEFPKTSENEFYSMTLKNAEIAYAIDHSDNGDNFFIPTESDLTSSTKTVLIPQDDNAMLYFEAEYKFIGKEAKLNTDFAFLDAFIPKLLVEDYSFSTDYFVFQKTNNEDWAICAANKQTDNTVREALGLDLPNVGTLYEYQPLEDKVYTLRGVILFPKKLIDECSKECTLSFKDGLSFTITPNSN